MSIRLARNSRNRPGRHVGPVQVVDDQQLRPVSHERGHEPVEAVQHTERCVRFDGRRFRQHHRPGQRRRTGERPGARGARHAAQPRLEQLADDPPRVRDLEVRRASARHGEAPRPALLADTLEQARLPDPGGALDDHGSSPARTSRLERRDDDLQLALSLVEPGNHAWRESMGRGDLRGSVVALTREPKMQRFRRDVGAAGPADRPELIVEFDSSEVRRVAQRLEYATPVPVRRVQLATHTVVERKAKAVLADDFDVDDTVQMSGQVHARDARAADRFGPAERSPAPFGRSAAAPGLRLDIRKSRLAREHGHSPTLACMSDLPLIWPECNRPVMQGED